MGGGEGVIGYVISRVFGLNGEKKWAVAGDLVFRRHSRKDEKEMFLKSNMVCLNNIVLCSVLQLSLLWVWIYLYIY